MENNNNNGSPPLCRLTQAQTQAALALKRAAIAKFTSDNCRNAIPSDYEIALHTLTGETDVNKLLTRIEGLYHMRQEYGVQDTLEDAIAVVNSVMEQAPGYLLHFEQRQVEHNHDDNNNNNNNNDDDDQEGANPGGAAAGLQVQAAGVGLEQQPVGDEQRHLHQEQEQEQEQELGTHGVYILDLSRIDYKKALANTRPFFLAMYYLFQACYPNLEAFRLGHISIIEAEGFTSHEDMAEMACKAASELYSSYPLHYKGVHNFNSATEHLIAFNSFKRYFPENYQKKNKLGCKWGQAPCSIRDLFAPPPTPLSVGQTIVLLQQQRRQQLNQHQYQHQHQEPLVNTLNDNFNFNHHDHQQHSYHNIPILRQELQIMTFWSQFVAAMELRLRNQAAFRLPPLPEVGQQEQQQQQQPAASETRMGE